MAIKQTITRYDNFTIKTYEETDDGHEILYEEFNTNGSLIYARYGDKKWCEWVYNDRGRCIEFRSSLGQWYKRRYEVTNKGYELVYEENEKGVIKDLARGINHYPKLPPQAMASLPPNIGPADNERLY